MMKTLLKVTLLNSLLATQIAFGAGAKNDAETPVFFQYNPFSPEESASGLKGVRILSVDDKDFPGYIRGAQKKLISDITKNGFYKTSDSKSSHSQVKTVVKNKKLERSLNKAAKHEFDQKAQSVISSLKLNMADLSSTPLKNSNLIDIEASGALQDTVWTGVSRLLEDEYFGVVILEEDDFSLHGGGVILTSELINVTVNGNPGMLVEERGADNQPYTILQWASDHKSFILKVTISASKGKPLENLIALAESLN